MAPTPTPSPSAATPDPTKMRPPIQAPTNSEFLQRAYAALDCSKPENYQGGTPDKPEEWLVTCSKDGSAKYLLEPAFIRGTQVSDAQAQLPQNGAGGWQVNLTFDTEGAKALADVSTRLVPLQPPKNQFGIILDGLVVSSPYFQEPILGGTASINGNFTNQQAKDLANVLKYGALPVNLQIAEITSVSPTLGADQLKAGLIAGALGLLLVVIYLLLYYRALGIVAVVSLMEAALLTYTVFVILGRTVGLALTLAGVAGAIVSIGITADSFVVYFERIRDDVRERKSLRVACETGWSKARNTLLAADFVSFLAAAILYFISIGNVRGFAFTLGLTTIVDVVVAFLFTRPIVALLARSKWFTRGGPLTGVSPERLGVEPSRELVEARAEKARRKQEKQTVSAGVGNGASSEGEGE
jgi:preprotein translocase subunit SecD